jgi:hypothetical protein
VLFVKLILPVLILLGLIISMFFLTSLDDYIAIFDNVFVIVSIIINYVDDIYVLTTKRLILTADLFPGMGNISQ